MKNMKNAFPETPDRCREAVMRAVGTYREENEPMRKRYMTPILVMVLVLALCATAYAITGFSLRDLVEKPSQAFDDLLVPVENTKDSHGLTITLGDALCDGTDLLTAIEVKAAEEMQPMYVVARLEGLQNGQPLELEGGFTDTEIGIERKAQQSYGLLYPSSDSAWSVPNRLLYEAALLRKCTGTIQWRLCFDLYTPNWPLVEMDADGSDPYEKAQGFVEREQIACSKGNISAEWIEAMMFSQANLMLDEVLTDTGAFAFSDSLSFSFETEVKGPVSIADDTIHQMDGYTVQMQEMTYSPLNLDYTLLFEFESCQIPEDESVKAAEMELLSRVRFLPEETTFREDKLILSEDGMTAIYQSKVRSIEDKPMPDTLTFHWVALSEDDKPDGVQEFTIKIK